MTHETTKKPHFDVVMRGYERAQVDEHIATLQRELSQASAKLRQERDFARNGSQQLVAERDNALRQLHSAQEELGKLRSSAAETTVELRPKDEISLFGGRLQTILTTAEQEATAAKAEAREAADRMREHARQEADALLTGARDEAETLRTQATEEADTLLAQAREEAETTLAQARQQADALLADARQQAAQLTEQATAEATTTLETARREESQVRDSLATLVQRRERVRRELTEIGTALEALLTDDGSAAAPEPSAAEPSAVEPSVVEPSVVDHEATDGAPDGATDDATDDATVVVAKSGS